MIVVIATTILQSLEAAEWPQNVILVFSSWL